VRLPDTLRRKCLAVLSCDSSLITIRISDCRQFSDIHTSQRSVATYLRCGEMFKYQFVATLSLTLSWTHALPAQSMNKSEVQSRLASGTSPLKLKLKFFAFKISLSPHETVSLYIPECLLCFACCYLLLHM